MSGPPDPAKASSASAISLTGSYDPVERRPEDRDDADGVLVAELQGLVGVELQPSRLDGGVPRLHVPVPAELLPHDLDVDAHHQVRFVGRKSRRRASLTPLPLERQAAQHHRFARAGRGGAGRALVTRRVPQVGQHPHAAAFDLGGLRVLVLVDHVLVGGLREEPVRLLVHECRHERGDVLAGVAVQHQLVVYQAVGNARVHAVVGDLVLRRADRRSRPGVHRGDSQAAELVDVTAMEGHAVKIAGDRHMRTRHSGWTSGGRCRRMNGA